MPVSASTTICSSEPWYPQTKWLLFAMTLLGPIAGADRLLRGRPRGGGAGPGSGLDLQCRLQAPAAARRPGPSRGPQRPHAGNPAGPARRRAGRPDRPRAPAIPPGWRDPDISPWPQGPGAGRHQRARSEPLRSYPACLDLRRAWPLLDLPDPGHGRCRRPPRARGCRTARAAQHRAPPRCPPRLPAPARPAMSR